MSTSTALRRRLGSSASTLAVVFVAALSLAACGENGGETDAALAPDYSAADLESLSFAADALPDMEYQPERSGAGAFTGGEENREVAKHLRKLGLEADYVSQFFAASRDSELGFVESTVLLFENESSADPAVDRVKAEYLEFLEAEEIDAPELGEQAFGIRGDFDGFPVYAFGWRAGDAIQVVTVAPNGKSPDPDSALELAEQLAGQGEPT